MALPGVLSGRAIALAVPDWLAAAAPLRRASTALLPELERVQALLFRHLQREDDAIDRRRRRPRGGGRDLAEACRRLDTALGPAPRVRAEMARLLREQEETAAWELRLRGRRTSATTRDLVRIGGRAALLRWPASAVAHLAGKPALQARLDRLAGSILLVALLLDDLADVADDARTGCCNAVLLAGRASDFHLCVQRGSLFVARWIETELDSIRRDSRGAPGAAAACARLCTAGRRSAASVFRWASAAALANQLRAG